MLIETKLMPNANEGEFDTTNEQELLVSDNDSEPQNLDQDGTEISDEPVEQETTEDTIEVSRAEFEKYKREAAAAKRLREKVGKEKTDQPSQAPALDQELISRTYLAAQAGITDKDVQNEALRLCAKFGMNIAEGMDDPDISTRLKNLQKQKETQKAIAKSTGGSATRTKDANYYVTYFKTHGDFPAGTPNSMIAKVTGILAGE